MDLYQHVVYPYLGIGTSCNQIPGSGLALTSAFIICMRRPPNWLKSMHAIETKRYCNPKLCESY